jgi:hypothetical protein
MEEREAAEAAEGRVALLLLCEPYATSARQPSNHAGSCVVSSSKRRMRGVALAGAGADADADGNNDPPPPPPPPPPVPSVSATALAAAA